MTITLGPEAQASIERVLEVARKPYYFVHINKCGGTSVAKALGIMQFHQDARSWRDRISKKNWQVISTFSVVRHPYERVCSMYRYMLYETDPNPVPSLNDWIYDTFAAPVPEGQSRPTMERPCTDWLVDEAGRPMVDLVVRLEELDQSWPLIKRLTKANSKPELVNTTEVSASNGVSALTADSIAIIDEVFSADFKNFGYGRTQDMTLPSADRVLAARPRWARVRKKR